MSKQSIIYDNSNIAESYAGTTTPLTFSFVSLVYSKVYVHFSRLMGVSEKEIEKNSEMYQNMVAFIGNRIYYNLSNWYKMLRLFPMYRFSSEFMEKMMGVEESVEKTEQKKGLILKVITMPVSTYSLIRIFTNFALLRYTMPTFSKKFFNIYKQLDKQNIKNKSNRELLELFDVAAEKLLYCWKTPIANDFAVMVSAGISDKLYKKWCQKNNSYEYMKSKKNASVATLIPGNKLLKIKSLIANDKYTLKLLSDDPKISFSNFVQKTTNQEIVLTIKDYLLKYSYRVPNELKLETLTMEEDPEKVFEIIKSAILDNPSSKVQSRKNRLDFEKVNISMHKKFVLKLLFNWSTASINRREDARYLRTLIFGFVRKLFLEIGDKFYKENIIEDQRDIFYLEIGEIRLLTEDRTSIGAKNLISKRKEVDIKWRQVKLPNRIESDKTPKKIEEMLVEDADKSREKLKTNSNSNKASGRIASQPKEMTEISGSALVLKEFDSSADFTDKILVTTHTDPGWTIIFPLLKGVIVERGGILSHAAIVARELDIPCVVGVQNATDMFLTGEEIKIDLVGGRICKTKL